MTCVGTALSGSIPGGRGGGITGGFLEQETREDLVEAARTEEAMASPAGETVDRGTAALASPHSAPRSGAPGLLASSLPALRPWLQGPESILSTQQSQWQEGAGEGGSASKTRPLGRGSSSPGPHRAHCPCNLCALCQPSHPWASLARVLPHTGRWLGSQRPQGTSARVTDPHPQHAAMPTAPRPIQVAAQTLRAAQIPSATSGSEFQIPLDPAHFKDIN